MSALRAIGHDRILVHLREILQAEGRTVALLVGPQASGKSFVLQELKETLSQTFTARLACGESLERDVDEHVLTSRVEKVPRREIAEIALDASEDVKAILDDGDVPFGRLIHRAIGYATSGVPEESLSDTQQRFLSRLLNVLTFKRPLLICDDLQYWDRTSLLFLRRLLRGDLDSAYKRLGALGIVMALDADRIPSDKAELIADIVGRIDVDHKLYLRRPSSAEFGAVLSELGLTTLLADDIQRDIFLTTNGNLAIAKSVISYLQQSGPSRDPATALPLVVAQIFEQMVAGIGTNRKQIMAVLGVLVASGRSLDLNLLACVMETTRALAEEMAKQTAEQLAFVAVSEEALSIDHESIRMILDDLLGADQRERHILMERCIRRLRPGDYGRRAAHLEAAGQSDSAAAMRVMERLRGIRSGRFGWRVFQQPPERHGRGDPKVAAWSATVDHYFQALSAGAVDTALTLLDSLDPEAPNPLPLEADYLRAQLLSDLNNDSNVERALGLVEELSIVAPDEAELWGRAKEIEILCLSNLRRPDEGRRVEGELRAHYQQRSRVDPEAELALNRLRRRSEAIHVPEVANDRLKAALAYFGPQEKGGIPTHWAEYLTTLNNLCANEMVLGRFDVAQKLSAKLSEAATSVGADVLRKPEYIWSNVLVVQYLAGTAPGDLIRPFEAITAAGHRDLVDSMLLQINLAALRAASGLIVESYAALSLVFQNFNRVDAVSPYVRHFASSNLAVLAWIVGDTAQHDEFLRAAAGSLEEMKDAEYSYRFLLRRHAILESWFQNSDVEKTFASATAIFEAVGMQVGPSWRLFGRPLLVTDIQYWAAP